MDAVTLKVGTELEAQMTYSVSAEITEGAKGDDGDDGTGGAAVNFSVGKYSVVEIADYAGAALVNSDVEGGSASAVTHVLVNADGDAVGTSTDGSDFYAIGDVSDGRATASNGGDKDGTRASLTIAAGATQVEVTATNAATVTIATELEAGQTLKAGEYSVVDDGGLQLQDNGGNIVAYSADGEIWTTESGGGDTILTTVTLSAGEKLTMGEAGVDGIDISSQKTASAAITTINDALDKVSAERSKLGATQNRLEHTIKNLDTSAENLQAAESRIRDVDMAKEMMEFTKNNILTQAAQAMLAQAIMHPLGLLHLLR
jgi:flagellin